MYLHAGGCAVGAGTAGRAYGHAPSRTDNGVGNTCCVGGGSGESQDCGEDVFFHVDSPRIKCNVEKRGHSVFYRAILITVRAPDP